MLRNYFLTAWRHLVKHKVYSLVNISGLSIGLAAVMLIMLYVQDEVSFDRFQKNGDHIYRLVHNVMDPTGHEKRGGGSGAVMADVFSKDIPEVQTACRMRSGEPQLVKKGNDILPEKVLYVDTSFFHMFSFPLLYGGPSSALQNEDDVVLSAELAKKYFNTTNAVGKTVKDFHTSSMRTRLHPVIITRPGKTSRTIYW